MRPTLIDLDRHSTTPCTPSVVQAMLPYFTERYGNAGSRSHGLALEAQAAVDAARRQVRDLIGGRNGRILFTSGATEANNLAILGVAAAAGTGHLVTTALEHSSVLEPMAHAESHGFSVSRILPSPQGLIDPQRIAAALRPDTILVSIMLANNEIGTIQPVADIARSLRPHGALLHIDAVQAPGWVPIDVDEIGADLLSLSAHKMYGPKGVGALYVSERVTRERLTPTSFGGGQQDGFRPGTLPVPLIVGMGAAAAESEQALAAGTPERIGELRDRLWAGLLEAAPCHLNGAPSPRLPHNLNFRTSGVLGSTLVQMVRTRVACSTGSACSRSEATPSHVLQSLGLSDPEARTSIRIGLGRTTTADDIEQAIEVFSTAIASMRAR
jgi:cysteine desulfurase